MTGPPGCGKNTLLNVYCKQKNVQLIKFRDVKETYLSEVSEKKKFEGTEDYYPEDLENLLYFLKSQC